MKLNFNTIITRSVGSLLSVIILSTSAISQDANILAYIDRGIKYYPKYVQKGLVKYGKASWYGKQFHGRATSNGERYNMYEMTAAHRTYAMNTILKVTNLVNKKSVKVRVNDRGPFYHSRSIDLSYGAAKKLGMVDKGVEKIKIEVLSSPKKAPVSLVTSKSSVSKKSYNVQLASFSNEENALNFKKQYAQKEKNIAILSKAKNNKKVYKVVLQFNDKESARKFIQSKKYKGCFLVS